MTKEWLGVLFGLVLAGAFSACEAADDDGTGPTTSGPSSSSTGQAGNAPVGGGGSGAQGGQAQGGEGGQAQGGEGGQAQGGEGGQGQGGQGGQGGGNNCASVPQPVGSIDTNTCGGTAVSSSSGGAFCEVLCDDQASNSYSVECDITNGGCECKYNGQTYCTCTGSNDCSNHCCPSPWDQVGFGQGGAGGSANATSVTVATSTATSVATTSGTGP